MPKEFIEQSKRFQSLDPGSITESKLKWFAHEAGLVPPDADPEELQLWQIWVKHPPNP